MFERCLYCIYTCQTDEKLRDKNSSIYPEFYTFSNDILYQVIKYF